METVKVSSASVAKGLLLAGCAVVLLSALGSTPVAASAGATCEGLGHTCHLIASDGTVLAHMKLQGE